MKFVRSKKLTFFNNKGGVGKTTLAYNVAVKFAEQGYKVCLVDLDPQCNLTRLCLGDQVFQANLFDSNPQGKSLYDVIEGIITAKGDIDLEVLPTKLSHQSDNLFLLEGSQNLSNYDDLLAGYYSVAASGNEAGYRQTSAISRFIGQLGMNLQFDLFIIDTSPTLGSLNRIILLDTDYFVVPINPDAFSLQGIENLGLKLEEWKKNWKNTGQALAGNIPNNLVLKGEGLFVGYILNSYNVYSKKLVKDHNKWASLIPERVKQYLSMRHARNGLVNSSYEQPISQIQDYGLIPARCQELSKAIFELDSSEVSSNHVGTLENIDKAKQEFTQLFINLQSILNQY